MKRNFTFRTLLVAFTLLLGGGTSWGETITKTVKSWNFKTLTWTVEELGESTIKLYNNTECVYATGALEGLALQIGNDTKWIVNSNGLTQGNGIRQIGILDLEAGDIVTIETATNLSNIYNGTSINDTYTGTCKFSVNEKGAFGITTDRGAYFTSITVTREVDAKVYTSWNFKTLSWNKESGFGTPTITINSKSCTYAIGDLDGLALQGGSGTGWTVNGNGLTQGNGERNIAILDLKAGDEVVVETACTISNLVNGRSVNDTYTGTCRFSVTSDGAFGFAIDRQKYITSITIYREMKLAEKKKWNFPTLTWVKETGFGERTITINNQSCTYAIGDLDGLALQFGSGTGWTVNGNGLTQGNGERNIAILNLKAGDVVTVVTACTISSLVNGTSFNGKYTGTCKFAVTEDGAFGFAIDRNKYITSIAVSEEDKNIGSSDCSTDYLGAISDIATLVPGSSAEFHFVNYNSYAGTDIDNAWNFVVPVYDTNNNKLLVIRADNWEDVKWTNAGCVCDFNWDTFDSEMNGATVDMQICYTSDNVFKIFATITTANGLKWKYFYTSDYASSDIALSGNIKTGISVSKSYVKMNSWKYGTSVPVEVSAAEWATLYTPFALNFAGTGLTAYTASVNENVVTLNEVTDVPANTGVVLKGNAGSYNIPLTASSTNTQGELQGSPVVARWTSDDADYYMLALNGNKVQFTKLISGSIAAGKAYLVLPKDPTTGARTLTVAFSEGGTTGIKQIENGELTIDNYYNLNGQRVSKPTKGLYIVNGKKVVLK